MIDKDDVIDDDPTATDDQTTSDDSRQDNPPEDPTARAAFFEQKYQEQQGKAKDLARDNKRLEGRVKEEETGKKYWHEEATRQQGAKPAADSKADAIDKTAEELPDLADLATSDDGTERLLDLVEKRLTAKFGGKPVTAKDVDKTIQTWVDGIQAGGRLQERYPDLAEDESEFTTLVNSEIEAMKQDANYTGVSKTVALELACARVDAKMARDGKRRTSSEDVRQRRVGLLPGNGAAKPARKAAANDELTENQKRIAKNYGLTEEEYRASAKKGISTYKAQIGS